VNAQNLTHQCSTLLCNYFQFLVIFSISSCFIWISANTVQNHIQITKYITLRHNLIIPQNTPTLPKKAIIRIIIYHQFEIESNFLQNLPIVPKMFGSLTRKVSSPLTTSTRTYIAKHTHFHQWKVPKVDTTAQIERRAQRQANRILSTEQYQRVKRPFDFPVISNIPVEQRKVAQRNILADVNQVELARLRTLPRETVPIKVGDRIAVTALLCMTEAKTQVYKGTVIQFKRGRGLYSRFTLRNGSEGGFYEITFPYWSPFLRKIEMIERDSARIKSKTRLANYHRNLPVDHPKNKIL
jgi:ribosomal protein L19